MKKLLLGSIVLTLFSISILLFQISCRKEVSARNTGDGTAGKILMSKNIEVKYFEQSGVDSLNNPHFDERILTYLEFYILKDDETAPAKINISLPPDEYPWLEARLSNDGSKIFFGAYHTIKGYSGVYACNVDGSDVRRIGDENFFLQDVK
ncbi:MAG: hypothetical protein QM768_11830 [Agriterribacter sp.]